MPLTHDIGVRIPYPLQKVLKFSTLFFCIRFYTILGVFKCVWRCLGGMFEDVWRAFRSVWRAVENTLVSVFD